MLRRRLQTPCLKIAAIVSYENIWFAVSATLLFQEQGDVTGSSTSQLSNFNKIKVTVGKHYVVPWV